MRRATWAMLSALAIGLAGCAHEQAAVAGSTGTASGGAESPVGTRWQWVGTITPVERIEVRQPEHYTMRLLASGSAEMRFDCNRGGGSYAISENRLVFGPLISTQMACPPDSQDTVFMHELDQVTTFFLREGELYLEMPMDSGTMRFVRAADQD